MSNEIKGTVATVGNISGTLSVASGFDGESAYEVAVKNGFEGTEAEWLESLHGESGVYVGTGDMPEDCNVQIDPNGEVFVVDQNYSPTSTNPISGKGVMEALAQNGIECSTSGESILLTDSSNYPLDGLKVYGKSTQDGTPTPEAPIDIVSAGASGSVEVKVCGANLFNANSEYDKMHYGTSIEVMENGRVIKATSDLRSWSQGRILLSLVGGVTYTMALDNITTPTSSAIELRKNGSSVTQISNNKKTHTFVAEKGATYHLYFIINCTGNTLTEPVIATYEGLRVNVGDTALPFEPYIPEQTLTLATPKEKKLKSVNIASSGNVVGKIDDVIDLERGVYIQNTYTANQNDFTIGRWTSTGAIFLQAKNVPTPLVTNQSAFCSISGKYAQTWNAESMAHNFTQKSGQLLVIILPNTYTTVEQAQPILDAGFEFVYALETPIEHTLSAEEIAYYKALHTNYPNTTIFNTDGTNMDVSYVADTKLYIDNKFAELQALALEG